MGCASTELVSHDWGDVIGGCVGVVVATKDCNSITCMCFGHKRVEHPGQLKHVKTLTNAVPAQ